MITPEFPYKGNQVIISSDRVTLHSKTDGIFLFGKATVGLSSAGTINMDSNEKVIINSPKIELGNKAETDGEPLVLGNQLVFLLSQLLIELQSMANMLGKSADGKTSNAGISMSKKIDGLLPFLQGTQPQILSTSTYTI